MGLSRSRWICWNKRSLEYEMVPGVVPSQPVVQRSKVSLPCRVSVRPLYPGLRQDLVPSSESLELLASHKTSMAIFLSVGSMEKGG